ncbi:MAG: hypothetical protein IPL38_16815 [Rhodobacter sp.]|nr:hypothetical protein [Rhodobacter sp.]
MRIGPEEELLDEDQIELMTALSGAGPAGLALMACAMLCSRLHAAWPPIAAARRRGHGLSCRKGCWRADGRSLGLRQSFIDHRGTIPRRPEAAEAAGFSAALEYPAARGRDAKGAVDAGLWLTTVRTSRPWDLLPWRRRSRQ